MDEVFSIALHRVILPQKVAGQYVIEVDDDEPAAEIEIETEEPPDPDQSAKSPKAPRVRRARAPRMRRA